MGSACLQAREEGAQASLGEKAAAPWLTPSSPGRSLGALPGRGHAVDPRQPIRGSRTLSLDWAARPRPSLTRAQGGCGEGSHRLRRSGREAPGREWDQNKSENPGREGAAEITSA